MEVIEGGTKDRMTVDKVSQLSWCVRFDPWSWVIGIQKYEDEDWYLYRHMKIHLLPCIVIHFMWLGKD